MSFNRKPPSVYRAKHRQRSGGYYLDSFFTFKVMHQGTLYYEKTNLTKKREAQSFVNNIFSSQENFKTFLDRHTNRDANIKEDTSNKPESVLSILTTQGWLSWETNPKLLNHKKQGKNYGSRHAKNISYALKNMFVDTDQYTWFSSKDISDVGRKDAQDLSSELWKHRTYRGAVCEDDSELKETIGSYKAHITALKTFFTYCFETLDITETNPFHRITIPKYRKRKTKPFFSISELKLIFDTEHLKTLDSDPKWCTFLESDYFKSFMFTALTGLRSGEVRALQWKQLQSDIILTVDRAFKENTTQEKDVDTPKWDKIRKIVLCQSAYTLIRTKEPKHAGEYIFKNSVGNAIDSSTWKKKFDFFISTLNDHSILLRDDYTPHSFRGTLNSLLLSQGNASGPVIRKYLGWTDHNSLSFVQEQHYTEFADKDLFSVAEAIEELFSGKKMEWEFISKAEKEEFRHLLPNWQFYKNKMLQNQDSSSSEMKELLDLKNLLFKEINNLILYDGNTTEAERQQFIAHCKKVLKMVDMTIDTLDSIFNQEFKKYLSKILKDLPASKQHIISLILDFFATQIEKEQN